MAKKKKKSFITSKATINALRKLHAVSGGLLLPETVVDSARDPKSPLHKHFDWDNTIAAEKWRLEQAGKLLRITVEYIDIKGSEVPQRVFVSLSDDQKSGGGYRATIDVLSDAKLRKQLLSDAMRDIVIFKNRYGHLKELAQVIRAMKKIKI